MRKNFNTVSPQKNEQPNGEGDLAEARGLWVSGEPVNQAADDADD